MPEQIVAWSSDGDPHWRVRVAPARGWRRLTDRRIAQADVLSPSGQLFHVRIKRNLPLAKSPLGPLDDFVPTHISLAVLLAANARSHGRTGWSIEVVTARTAWRAERVVQTRRSREQAEVIEHAVSAAEAIRDGRDPEHVFNPGLAERVRHIMDWD